MAYQFACRMRLILTFWQNTAWLLGVMMCLFVAPGYAQEPNGKMPIRPALSDWKPLIEPHPWWYREVVKKPTEFGLKGLDSVEYWKDDFDQVRLRRGYKNGLMTGTVHRTAPDSTLIASIEVQQYRINGRIIDSLEGRYQIFDDEGYPVKDETWIYGKKEGTWLYFDLDGEVNRVINYENDTLHGESLEMYDSHWVLYQYENGRLSGPCLLYTDTADNPYQRIWYNNNRIIKYDPIVISTEGKPWQVDFDNGQEGIVWYYHDGMPWKLMPLERGWATDTLLELDHDTNIVSMAAYSKGLLNGEYKLFDRGYMVSKITFVDGIQDGPTVAYTSPDTLAYLGRLKNGKQDSTWIDFWRNGQVSEVNRYVNGLPFDTVRLYHPDGERAAIIPIRKGSRQGLAISWNKEGVRIREIPYADGLEEGIAWSYDPETGYQSRTLFHLGNSADFTTITDTNGQIVGKGYLENGIRHGKWVLYDGDYARFRERGQYYNGQRIGNWMSFHTTSGLPFARCSVYENDLLLETSDFYPDTTLREFKKWRKKAGKGVALPLPAGTIKAGNGKVLGYYSHGPLLHEIQYEKGVPHGPTIGYFDNGKPAFKGMMSEGDKHSNWKYYREDGTLYYEATYDQGTPIGIWTYYDKKGKVLTRRNRNPKP